MGTHIRVYSTRGVLNDSNSDKRRAAQQKTPIRRAIHCGREDDTRAAGE